MKKTLIALAVLAASGASFAQVTLYGVVSGGYQASKATSTSAGVTTDTRNDGFVSGGGLNGDRIGFKGTEDLGAGLKANFVFEGAVNTATGGLGDQASKNAVSTFSFDRESNFGLSGNFGAFTVGRTRTLLNSVILGYDAFATQGISAVNLNPIGTRIGNAATYKSNSFGGFDIGLQYGTLDTGVSSADTTKPVSAKATSTGAKLGYAAGPFAISLAFGLLNGDTAAAGVSPVVSNQTSGNSLGLSYDFGAAKVFALATTGKTQADTAKDAYVNDTEQSIGLVVPVGAISLLGSVSRNTKSTVAATGAGGAGVEDGTKSGNGNNWALGAYYNLSKRTVAFAKTGVFSNYNFGASAAGTANSQSTTASSIGITHNF